MQLNRDIILRELVRLRVAFPEIGYDEQGIIALVGIWQESLPDMPEEGFKAAVAHCLVHCRFFPKPQDLVKGYESWCRTQGVRRTALPEAPYKATEENRQMVAEKVQKIRNMLWRNRNEAM